MDQTQVEEREDAIGGTILVQPIKHHIPDLNDATSDRIYELRGSLKTKKCFVTRTLKDAKSTKVKLDAELAKIGIQPNTYGIQAFVNSLKSKSEKLNSII